jgi:hypothetical protein
MYVSKVWESVARRDRKRFIASWGQDVTYLSLHPMPPSPRVEVKGQKSSFCPPLLWRRITAFFKGQRNPLIYNTASISDEYERVNKGVSFKKMEEG